MIIGAPILMKIIQKGNKASGEVVVVREGDSKLNI